jgi:prepilin-type N-terminal cleavage/methylation domain-containing protein
MTKARLSERGMSMVEVLVALAVLVVAATIALLIYEASRKSFKRGENISEQQQAVRIAFDRLTSDLRMAGFNYNPDGDPNRPDEQIEAAFDTAVVVRADYDAEDATESVTPESTLDGGTFLTVSTGNDEIVAYVLAKEDGSSTDTLSFLADVEEAQRDGDVETINIPNVALVHDDPPYTLYRVTFNDDTTFGGSGFIEKTPLIDNVQSMSFRYYNQVGNQINTAFDLTTIAEDIGGAESAATVATRGSIRRIGIEVVGLTRDADLDWFDPDDTNPNTRRYQKFPLNGDVTPRNLGMVGIQDLAADVTPPTKPGTPTLVPGHCEGLYAMWAANPPDEQVTSYRLNLGIASGAYSTTRSTSGTSIFVGGLAMGNTYYGMVQASDAAGNLSIPSNEASTALSDVNTPEAPQNPAATTDLNGAVKLTWDAVTANTEALPAADPNLRDLAGYRVYRGKNPSFNPNVSGSIADESTVGNKPNPEFIDQTVINCKRYYYQITAVDKCGNESAASVETSGLSTSDVRPRVPENVQVFFQGLSQVKLTWDEVVKDVNDATITIETYNIYRTGTPLPNNVTPTDASAFTLVDTVNAATEYTESYLVPIGYTHWYAVSAVDDCPNESLRSEPVRPECAFSGDVVFVEPTNGQPVAGVVPVTVAVQNSTDQFVEVILDFYHVTNAQLMHREVISTTCDANQGPCSWTYNWLANPPGPYTITATVTNGLGCPKTESISVASGFSVGCCLSPPDPTISPIVMACTGPKQQTECTENTWQLINNNCLTSVAIEELIIGWNDAAQTGAKLTGVKFDNTLIWNVTPPSPSPASNVFSDPKPDIPVGRNSSNPVDVTFTFDQVTSRKIGPDHYQDGMAAEFRFRLLDAQGRDTSITGTCSTGGGSFAPLVVERHN